MGDSTPLLGTREPGKFGYPGVGVGAGAGQQARGHHIAGGVPRDRRRLVIAVRSGAVDRLAPALRPIGPRKPDDEAVFTGVLVADVSGGDGIPTRIYPDGARLI